jgi:lipoprotein-releasing system permease protein
LKTWLPFEWIAATRFLREGRMQSLLIIVGVGVGVSVIVFMSALLSGLQSNLIKRTLSSQAHITLLPPEEIARPQQDAPATALRLQKQAQRLRPSTSGRRCATA